MLMVGDRNNFTAIGLQELNHFINKSIKFIFQIENKHIQQN